jgi:hypothetical protein
MAGKLVTEISLKEANHWYLYLAAGNKPASTDNRTTNKMDIKNIAYGLQTKLEVSCREQEELIKAAIALLYEQDAKIEILTYHLDWINQKEAAQ